jgi:hypothetical protein
MNPFETGLVAASGLNATMARKIAEKKERTVNARSFPFFYNPMWSLLGDASDGSPGSYYRSYALTNYFIFKSISYIEAMLATAINNLLIL